jgi:hypothetical protein
MTLAATYREALLEGLRDGLRAAGFKKRGAVFHRASHDVVHLVGLQSSIDSPGQIPQVTLNLAVWCKARAAAGTEPTVIAAAWRCRLADVMPQGAKRWWPIAGKDAVPNAARELSAALKAHGIPALDRLPDAAALDAYLAARAVQPS